MIRENLLRARSNIIFILALVSGFALVSWIERHSNEVASAVSEQAQSGANLPVVAASKDLPALPAPQALGEQERQWAQVAWKYFENNTQRATGLVNSVDKYEAATMWDTASYLLALVSAQRLGLIQPAEFDSRAEKALASLARLPLYDNTLPNKSYNTATLDMVDYRNQPTPKGIGWSAIDLARLIVPLHIIAWQYPKHATAAAKVVARWQTARLLQEGQLFGVTVRDNGEAVLLQEGRLGYEQYSGKALALQGLIPTDALDYRTHLRTTDIYGVAVPYDERDAAHSDAHNYVVSEPYVLDGLEFGWDHDSRELAWRVYRAQEQRFRQTGQLTAVTEDHVDRAPYFVYNTVFADGKAWNATTEKGEDASALRSISVKAAFGWHALYRSNYTAELVRYLAQQFDPERGWYAGVYESGNSGGGNATNRSINANTNAVVLESLAYMATGRLLTPTPRLEAKP